MRRWHLRALLVVALFTTVAAVAAVGWSRGQHGPLRVWAANPYVKLQASTAPRPWRPVLVAPRGGRASFQLVVDNRGRPAAPTAGALSGPRGRQLTRAVSVLRELTVPIAQQSTAVAHGLLGQVPDPLVAVSVKPSSGPRQAFWVSIAVPRSATPGTYRGSIRAAGRVVPYRMRVAAVTLPREHALHTWFLVWSTHADDAEHRADAAQAYTHLLATYGIGDGTEAGGDTAVGLPPYSLAANATGGALQQLAGEVAKADARLRERLPGAAPYSYVIDEPAPDQLPEVRAWGDALAQAAPGVRQLVTSTPDPSVGSSVGAWAMHLASLTPAVLAQAHQLGAQAWVYSSCCETPGDPTLMIDQDAVGNLAVAPAAWEQGAAGVLYWSVNDYTGDPYTDPRQLGDQPVRVGNGDGVLLYPGRPLGERDPNPSLRLVLVAAGLQIADEAALLSQRGQADEAHRALARVLPGTAQFADDPAAWLAVERTLLRDLERTR